MDEIIALFKTILGPAAIGAAIVAIVNWFKIIPGAQDPKLSALWPGVAAVLGGGLFTLYAWVVFGLASAQHIVIVAIVGFFLGLAAAGIYKLADKINK